MAVPGSLDVEQAILDYEEARDKKKKGFKLFGRYIGDVPCFREAYMTGIFSCFGGGLSYFLFTSNTRRACHMAVLAFTSVTMADWFYCRYARSRQQQEIARFKAMVRRKQLTEGVDITKSELFVDLPVEDVSVVILPKRAV